MVTFFCTRCGTRLQVDPAQAGRDVRCGHCTRVVPSPGVDDALPEAVIADAKEIDESDQTLAIATAIAPPPMWPLAYRMPWMPPSRWRPGELELLAERLEHVEPALSSESGMGECPYCGSTIAGYVGRCPFCRHPLRGS